MLNQPCAFSGANVVAMKSVDEQFSIAIAAADSDKSGGLSRAEAAAVGITQQDFDATSSWDELRLVDAANLLSQQAAREVESRVAAFSAGGQINQEDASRLLGLTELEFKAVDGDGDGKIGKSEAASAMKAKAVGT